MDWWYVCAYPGRAELMDEATRVLIPWLKVQARQESAAKWFFIRYWDTSGHHLRMRVQCTADGADRLYSRTEEIAGLLRTLKPGTPSERLVPGAAFSGVPRSSLVRTRLYAPELARYGGERGVHLAEKLFTASTSWYAEQDLAGLDHRLGRAALAIEYMQSIVSEALPLDDQKAFWAEHRRHWGWQLRMVIPEREDLRALLRRRVSEIESSTENQLDYQPGLRKHVDTIRNVLDIGQAAALPVTRSQLLLYYMHMDLNRWGFLPAEECLLGLISSSQIPT
ncbi:hypothetical protein OG462_43585 [Streptomyces sp. NBC_01077]|uniref:lantibiotic dehydratase C-terminal domain-containing protein n=1 Tax=Streptomyces sp. NBC_01077 TaxID=2903746 RepID=UPI003863C745|nr:hypothetical protein OG462_01420 [Streptomyces sp. NBC_01077]WSV43649.1 hypothetical protein OG462_43585 [Streptomyces sp. NBC_01077]